MTRLPVLVQVRKKPKRTDATTPAAKGVIEDLTESPEKECKPEKKEQHDQKEQPNLKEQVKFMDVLGSMSAPTAADPTVRKLEYQEPPEQVLGGELGPDVATRLQEKNRSARGAPSTLAADDYWANVHAAIGDVPTLPVRDKTEVVDLVSANDLSEPSIFDALAASQCSQPPLGFGPLPDSVPPAELDPYEQASQCAGL